MRAFKYGLWDVVQGFDPYNETLNLFGVSRDYISMRVHTLSRFTTMPRWFTMKTKIFPYMNSNAHLCGLSFIRY